MSSDSFLLNLLIVYLIPLIMLVMGIKYQSKAPKYPKGDDLAASGYRTPRSLLSEDTWNTAHTCFGFIWTILGFLLLAGTFLSRNYVLGQENFDSATILVVMIQIFFMTVPPILITELRLRMLFDENGERKAK